MSDWQGRYIQQLKGKIKLQDDKIQQCEGYYEQKIAQLESWYEKRIDELENGLGIIKRATETDNSYLMYKKINQTVNFLLDKED